MNTIDHAKSEFQYAGYRPPETLMADDPNRWFQENVLELLEVFANQGHSGFSAPAVIEMFSKLAKLEIMTPLTGKDEEWNDVSEMCGRPQWQNIRDSRVFKDEDGTCTQIEGIIWQEDDGSCYTNRYSTVKIESFPYSPSRIYKHSSCDPSNHQD